MTTTSAYFDKGDLDDRMSAAIVQRCFADDNGDSPNAGPIARFIADACSRLDGVLRATGLDVPVQNPPNECKRMALDIAEWMMAKRFPEITRKNWVELKKASDEDLMMLRKGTIRLDIPKAAETPETTPANVGAKTGSTNPDDPDGDQGHWGDMGDF